MTVYCGVDFHARQQTVCYCDTADGEVKFNDLLSIVFEFTEFDLAVGGITVANCLLTSMKINSAVYCHGCLLLRSQTHNLSLTAHLWGETPFFITSDKDV